MNQKAREQYHERANRVNAQINELCVLVREYGAGDITYGHVGSMGHVIEELDNLIRSVKSGVISTGRYNDDLIARAHMEQVERDKKVWLRYEAELDERNRKADAAARGELY